MTSTEDITNILKAISMAVTIVTRINDAIQTARAENRDITDEELRSLRQESEQALEKWREAAPTPRN